MVSAFWPDHGRRGSKSRVDASDALIFLDADAENFLNAFQSGAARTRVALQYYACRVHRQRGSLPLNFTGHFFSEALGMVPLTFGWHLRQETYRRLGVCRGKDIVLNYGTTIGDRRTTIGSDVWLGRDVYLEYADVGDHVLIGPGSVLLAGARHHRTNNVDVPIKLQGNNPLAPIRIGEGVWIGANTTVMADVGRHAIVGAGAVVTKPVPDYAVVAGNPARIVRDRRQVTPRAIDDQKSEIVLTVDGASMAERVLE